MATKEAMSTAEKNKALWRRYIDEVVNEGNYTVVDEIIAPDFVVHMPGSPSLDREGYLQLLAMFRTAFPDFHVMIEDLISEGDKAVVRWIAHGTHSAEFQGIAPTDRQITFTAIGIMRFADGKFTEGWAMLDTLGLMQQLGAIPA